MQLRGGGPPRRRGVLRTVLRRLVAHAPDPGALHQLALAATLVTPLTGPLARYGTAGADALRLWAERASGVPAAWGRVELDVVDAHPDPVAAMNAAAARRPDVWFGPYGSSPALAALAAVVGADGPVVWNHGGATSRLAWPEFPRVLNVLAPACTYFAGALRAVRVSEPSARTTVLLHGDSGFANDVATGAIATAAELGYEVATVAFEPGAAASAARRMPAADVLLVAGSFADEVAAARLLLGGRPRPWRAAAFVGAGVEDVLVSFGAAREGLLGPTQWVARAALDLEPDEGPDARWFSDAYRRATGGDPEYPAAQAFAAGVLAARCLREADSAEPDAVIAAALRLACRTLYGTFQLDPRTGRQVGHQVLTVQWQDGARCVVWPPEQAERPLLILER